MAKLQLLMGVVGFALWVFCLIDVIGTDSSRTRNLPKVAWVVLVLLFPLVGSIAWLVAGRPEGGRRRSASGTSAAFPEYERPGRFVSSDPAKDEEFLRQVRERAEEQRRRYEAEKKAREERERQGEPEPEPDM